MIWLPASKLAVCQYQDQCFLKDCNKIEHLTTQDSQYLASKLKLLGEQRIFLIVDERP